MSRSGRVLTATFLLGLAPASLTGQSAADVFSRMLAEQDRRAARVENYTLVQEVMGMTMTIYMVKEMVGSHAVFHARDTKIDGMTGSQQFQVPADVSSDLYSELPTLGAQARYVKRDAIEGKAVHVVEIPDLSKARAFQNANQPSDARFEPGRGTFFVDAEQWVPRRMIIEGTVTREGKTSDVTMTMDLQDYREVEGLLHPFRTTVRVEGMVDPQMQGQIRQMKQQMEQLPEAQRKMMEQMLQGQMGQLMNAIGDDGSMTFDGTVRELRVNAGPPK